jgi:hypothetical protein
VFVPKFEAVLNAAGLTVQKYKNSEEVTINRGLFDLLIGLLAISQDFDEEYYLACYPDVANSVADGGMKAHEHYVKYGYFEGRVGCRAHVDEEWYLEYYPDVAKVIESGELPSADMHYHVSGCLEWRSPNRAALEEVAVWRVLAQSSKSRS